MTNTEIIVLNLLSLLISLLVGWGLAYLLNGMEYYIYYVWGSVVSIAFLMGRDFGRKN